MSFDGIVTRKIVNELKKEILGGKIQKISQPSKNDIIFNIYSMRKSYKLFVSANNNEARINFTEKKYENPEKPDNFCMVLRKHINQGKIIDIKQYGLDRVVELSIVSIDEMGFDTSKKLIIEIMGKHSNVILTDTNYKIIDSIKRINEQMSSVRQIFPSLTYERIKSEKIDITDENFNKDIFYLNPKLPNSFQPYKIFYTYYEGLSPIIGKELVHRAKIDPRINWGLVSEDEKKELNNLFLALRNDILNDNLGAYDYRDERKIKEYHAIRLNHLNFTENKYDLMSLAIDNFYSTNKSNDRLDQMKDSLLKKINSHKKSVKKKINILNENIAKEALADDAKKNADLLAANLYRIENKAKEIILEDFYNENKPIKISLNPMKSPWENINGYYNRAKKIKAAIVYAQADLPNQKSLLTYLEQLEDFITRADSISDLEDIRDEMQENKLIKKKAKDKKKAKPSKPLHYQTESGADIYVGKNSKQNDYITLKVARKDDLWFHVKDSPGSHVVLKTDHIYEEDILTAAYLAAKNSSLTNDNKVDVDYTEKKNVNKAKGAKEGMVYYEKFSTITIDLDKETKFNLKKI
ncbi:putative fibronectin-binding protein [Anaerococcus lactolyticus ATCC 51172]|uniref:Rqc2 homolog RqcH n=1 Tax=Anaerococcus lactolyticus ATCC 51172 TaxID=525254 RepID=C2BDI3_9FIRM|nr:NFACT RNA binding domain-containing protein [Anaerococcus lactolyticus]EEI87012.1 putative fibronectin-binding protein [Anaerococcus lactolyticus ATCC 51172]